jgi:hypothetical protein
MPVTKAAASLARKSTASATSSGVPMRFIGVLAIICSRSAGIASRGKPPVRCMIGVSIGRSGRDPLHSADRAREHDRGALRQERQSFLHSEEDALQIGVLDPVPIRLGHRLDGQKGADPRIHEQDIDSPVIRANLGEQSIDVLQLGDVGALCNRTVADLLHGRPQGVRVTPADDHAGPLLRESLCRSEPNTAVAANDDSNLALEALSQEIPLHPPRMGAGWPSL